MAAISRRSLLNNATANGKGRAVSLDKRGDSTRAFKARVVGTGAVTATVEIYGSDKETTDETDAVLIGTITLNATNVDVDGFASDAPWPWVFAKLSSLTGTGATVNSEVLS